VWQVTRHLLLPLRSYRFFIFKTVASDFRGAVIDRIVPAMSHSTNSSCCCNQTLFIYYPQVLPDFWDRVLLSCSNGILPRQRLMFFVQRIMNDIQLVTAVLTERGEHRIRVEVSEVHCEIESPCRSSDSNLAGRIRSDHMLLQNRASALNKGMIWHSAQLTK
jgi:hypothetical protein